MAFGTRRAGVAPQATTLGGARLWVLPNPSGRNVRFPPDGLARAYRQLRDEVGAAVQGGYRRGRRLP
jgi:TDG/mug DNA glycosylase family protein